MCLSCVIPYDDYNRRIGGEVVGAVRQNFCFSAFTNGWKLIEVYED